MEINPQVVLSWLGRDSAGASYHLIPLNLTWSAAGVDADLAVFSGVAERLADHAELWSTLLRETNWRYTLVGGVCLLVSGNQEHWEDLRWRMEEGSFVAPQLLVFMGLLHPDQTRAWVAEWLDDHAGDRDTKSYGAALVVRDRLASDAAEPADRRLEGDAVEGASVAEEQWAFWSQRLQVS